MTTNVRVPAYRVTIRNENAAGRPVLKREIFRQPAGAQALLEYMYTNDPGTHLKIRLKGAGGCQVTARVAWRNMQLVPVSTEDEHGVVIAQADGQKFRVTVRELPPEEWAEFPSLPFQAPRAFIHGEPNGWRVVFHPQQYPCVLTAAVDANKIKDENLPSFPFPSNPRYSSAGFLILRGAFGAQHGGTVRLGVRGAGLSVRAALPPPGEVVEISPELFQQEGPTQVRFLEEGYALQKFNEKRAMLSYTL